MRNNAIKRCNRNNLKPANRKFRKGPPITEQVAEFLRSFIPRIRVGKHQNKARPKRIRDKIRRARHR